MQIEVKKADVLILGAGLAGLYTALHIDKSKKIVISCKESLGLCNSYLAQGGIAGEITTDKEILEKHIRDTIIAVGGAYDFDAIQQLVYGASENLKELIHMGVPFDKDQEGNLLLTKEGGHSKRRILHAGGDATGLKIMETLIQLVKKCENITILENYMVYDLLMKDEQCFGAKLIHTQNTLCNVFATSTIIATGGIGAIYQDSTNAHGASGDGIAVAYRAGAKLNGMEFVQFHPTVFYDVTGTVKGQKFLISESVRGEGAYLLNINQERFMQKYDSRLELAPRDVVSQSILKELEKTNCPYVYIDARHLGKEFLKKRFPTIYAKCLEYGYKMEEDLIPVAPVEHFGIGGIKIDLDGKTSISHLFANGECASSGVHGANRLASNSLLECVVFGKKIANAVNQIPNETIYFWNDSQEITYSDVDFHTIRVAIRQIMSKYVFIARTTKGLAFAEERINEYIEKLKQNSCINIDYYRALNTATVAKLIVDAAIARKESLGSHLIVDEHE